jgi:hypothetical protein
MNKYICYIASLCQRSGEIEALPHLVKKTMSCESAIIQNWGQKFGRISWGEKRYRCIQAKYKVSKSTTLSWEIVNEIWRLLLEFQCLEWEREWQPMTLQAMGITDQTTLEKCSKISPFKTQGHRMETFFFFFFGNILKKKN